MATINLQDVTAEFLIREVSNETSSALARRLIADELMARFRKIKERLDMVEGDERLGYPTATVFENAPLALIQCGLENQRSALMYVLKVMEGKAK